MSAGPLPAIARYGAPALVFAGAAAVSLFLLPTLEGSEARWVAAAAALDFTIAAPALAFLLLVRTKRMRWTLLLPIFFVGYALALLTIPERHHGVLEALRLAAIPAELGLVAYLVLVARKTLRSVTSRDDRDADLATRFRAIARQVLGARLPADVVTTEAMLLCHALRWRQPLPERANAFTMHREAGYLPILIGLGMALAFETVALHVLVNMWSPLAAWILTALSVYALLWLIGDYRAIAARPIVLTRSQLLFRLGLRWEADIPRDRIVAVERLENPEKRDRGTLTAALLGAPNVRVLLNEPVEVVGMYGLRRRVAELRLRVDEAEAFRSMLAGS